MKTSIKHFDGLFGDDEVLPSSDFLQCEALEIRSRAFDWEISEHFHSDLYQLFIIRKGGGTYKLNKEWFSINEMSVLLIPINTLHGFQFEENVEGEVITMSERLVEGIIKSKPELTEFLFSKKAFDFRKQTEAFRKILLYYQYLKEEIPIQKKEKSTVVKSLLELIFIELFRNTDQLERLEVMRNNRSLIYYDRFRALIKLKMDQSVLANYYAKELGISLVHLNRVCRELVDKSALEVIQDILIKEAKNYLLNTQYGIAEIAYFLNFNDPAYFNRFFKKKVGVPPGMFRKE